MKPKIENWSIYNGALVGRVYGHPYFSDGTNIITPLIKLDLEKLIAYGKNRIYYLGESQRNEETICAKPEGFV